MATDAVVVVLVQCRLGWPSCITGAGRPLVATDAVVVVLVKVLARGGLELRHPELGFAGGGFPDRLLSHFSYRSKEKRYGRYSDSTLIRRMHETQGHQCQCAPKRKNEANQRQIPLLSCFQAKCKNGI